MKSLSRNSRTLIVILSVFFIITVHAETQQLPDRENPRPVTTTGIPHIQIDVEPVPGMSDELLRQVSQLSGVDLRSTVVGRAGSTGFWLSEDTKLTRPKAIIRGREFAHLHPDGSLHASLPPKLAVKAVEAGWAIAHPWATSRRGLEGFVMIYTPSSKAELEVVVQLVMASHGYVTGKESGL